ncbi:site-2 protease family protein [Beggiatoa leptomitoformis]|uniref:Site-2 protease family protein n=1 Tax=Beggiatoa leptomitoformis TaxID=288004 RepID=A0A2N9YFE2_9GAMM|nr:site-2 protease family protein [Beggiatoa leptomitoformis]ALG68514.1 site-2 protease family protein [Beggiatoa leptomitoformis]AUI69146.1 site-2 protease family protein [Beggiatoa leptomitoformis]
MTPLTTLQQVSIWIIPILFAITVHEAAHGWAANKLGDDTAKRLGRITLNPIKHIDLIGTIILPIAMLLLSGFMFGWAKPVPVNWHQLHNPRRDMAFVAAAGPLSNLLMALFWVVIAKIGWVLADSVPYALFLFYMGGAGMFINSVLALLNLVPILPLDGGRVLHSLLPLRFAIPFGRSEPFGLFILLGLLFIGALGYIVFPAVIFLYVQLSYLTGIPNEMFALLRILLTH